MAANPDNVTNPPEQSPPAAVPGAGVTKYNAEVLAACRKAFEELRELEGQGKEINAKKTAVREAIYARGVNKHAFAADFAYWKMDAPQREGWDTSHHLLRDAVDLPIQPGLFTLEQAPVPQPPTPTPGRGKQH